MGWVEGARNARRTCVRTQGTAEDLSYVASWKTTLLSVQLCEDATTLTSCYPTLVPRLVEGLGEGREPVLVCGHGGTIPTLLNQRSCPAKTASQTQRVARSHPTWTRSTRTASYPSPSFPRPLVQLVPRGRPRTKTRISPQGTAFVQPSAKSSTSIAPQPSCLAMEELAQSQA